MEIFRHPGTAVPDRPPAAVDTGFEGDHGVDALAGIDMPSGLRRWHAIASGPLPRCDDDVRRTLERARAALAGAGGGASGSVVSLSALTDEQRRTLADVVGTGEVDIRIGGTPTYAIEETAFTGLWRGQARDDGGGVIAEWLEVADVPRTVREAVDRFTVGDLGLPSVVPDGCMNVLPLLHELRTRMLDWRGGAANHVISLSLFPLSPADAATLTHILGQAPLDLRSKGYGSCRVVPTRRRHVWAVQYFNVMEKVILDTLEIGDVPAAVLAGREDFADAVRRLDELLDAGDAGAAA